MKTKIKLIFITLIASLCCFYSFSVSAQGSQQSFNFTLTSYGDFNQTDFATGNCNYHLMPCSTPTTCSGTAISHGYGTTLCSNVLHLETFVRNSGVGDGYYEMIEGIAPNENPYHSYYILTRQNGSWTSNPIGSITVSAPASNTTITSLSTNLVGTWSGVSYAKYEALNFYFSDNYLGITTNNYLEATTSPHTTGSFSIPLSAFGITTNGTYNLHANAFLFSPQLSDMLVSEDMLSPVGYHLIFNISGFSTPFSFTNFDTWYSENGAGGYEFPSDFATAIVGFISPILENVVRYANQSLIVFSQYDSFKNGYQLGSVFPISQAYINQFNIFFGGFPLIQFLEFVIIVMIGIFTIRTIFKFIPFGFG